MIHGPKVPEVDERMIKLLIGLIAIMLPSLVWWLSRPEVLGSISASYWEGPWPQTIFIGFLFAIAGFLLAYDGRTTPERVASKIAAVAALLIALFPCGCTRHEEIIQGVHYAAAVVMYCVLAFFCWKFRKRALLKRWVQARVRVWVYTGCGLALVLAIAMLAFNYLANDALSSGRPDFVFVWEAVGLGAFGLSWLTASHFLPFLNARAEWFNPIALTYKPPVEPASTGEMDGG